LQIHYLHSNANGIFAQEKTKQDSRATDYYINKHIPFELNAPTGLITVRKRTSNATASVSSPVPNSIKAQKKKNRSTGIPSSSYKLDGP
jgi:hypothetical protein